MELTMANFISRNHLLASIARLKVRQAKAEAAYITSVHHTTGIVKGLQMAIDELELLIKEDKYWSDVIVNLEKAKRRC